MGQIVLKNITFTLDDDSIQKAIDTVEKLKEKLADGLSELARKMTEEYGVRTAKMYIAEFSAIDSGTLQGSINGQYVKSDHAGRIFTDVEYAVLVEYGTGIVGAQAPHPGIGDPNWNGVSSTTVGEKTYSSYDQEGHGYSGWWYPSEKGWYRPKDGGPLMAWTKGMPSRPYMYTTMLDIELEAEREGARIIAEYIP